MSNKRLTVYYVGMTGDLNGRIFEHKNKIVKGFTYRYNIDQLLYYEDYGDVNMAISREKEIKNWRREKKLHLISGSNPRFSDLAKDWY